jgi:phosphatidate cytidylyltransferase
MTDNAVVIENGNANSKVTKNTFFFIFSQKEPQKMTKKKSPKLSPQLSRANPTTQPIQEPETQLLINQPSAAKWKNWWIRTFWTFLMIFGFFFILYAGPIYAIILVAFLQIIVYREVLSISIIPSRERSLPWFRSLHWFYLVCANYFLYGESIIYYFKPIVFVDAFLMPLATHHRFISFSLYCIGLVVFVLNLKKGFYKFQFSMFCWIHMALLLIVVQSHFIINNIFEGLIWFILPCSLVICNDIFAYVGGFLFGKTPLIQISPKKTWEGFFGGFIITVNWNLS